MKYTFKYFIIAAFSLILGGCAGMQLHGLNPIDEIKLNYTRIQAANWASQARYLEASEILWDAAENLSSPQKEIIQLESARMLIAGQYLLNARRQLSVIDEQALEPRTVLDKRILSATFYQHIKQPEKIVELLPEELIDEGDDELKKMALLLRADALHDTYQYIDSLLVRIELKEFLGNDEYATYTDKIWRSLIAMERGDVQEQLQRENQEQELKAWLELALLATPAQTDITQLELQYQRWISEYDVLQVPDNIHEKLRARWAYFDFQPEQIFLILPLTGEYAKLGRVVRDGFLAAREEARAKSSTATAAHHQTQITFYDSNQERSVVELYQDATWRGADLVVGPLLKGNVDDLLNHSVLTVPVITLNYATHAAQVVDGEVFQFGLYPEDEAVQIAKEMADKKYNSVVVMAADNEWGIRMVKQFSDIYEQLAGTIQEVHYYDTEFNDYASGVQSLFHLDQSIQRHAEIEEVIRKELEFRPRIRDDINAAILFASYQKAMLIYPLMKFYYADELPVYASSNVYDPSKKQLLRELDGLIYSDIPFIIDRTRYPRSEKIEKFPRLYALGADAYRLTGTIRRIAASNARLEGATGFISVDKNRRLRRHLSWAQFNKGKPIALAQ